MALTLVTGPANAGKTRVLHEAVEMSAESGGAPVLLVPSAPDKQRLVEEFAEKAVCGVRVEVFDRWLAEQWALHGDGRLPIGEFARRVLVARALEKVESREIAHSARYEGFISLLVHLARSGLSGDAPVSGLSSADHEIANVLRTYRSLLEERGLIEPAYAAHLLARNPPALNGPIAVNRFNDLSDAQEAFVCGLARVNAVLVALTWERGHPATEAVTPLVERLACEGEHRSVVGESASKPDELELVARGLFRPGETIRAHGSLRIVEALDVEGEFDAIARTVGELLESGLAPHEVAVVFRRPARRVYLLERLARILDVAVDVDVALPFSQTPYGSAFRLLLRAACGNGDVARRITAFMASPYSGLDPDACASYVERWQRHGLDGSQLLLEAERLPGRTGRIITVARSLARRPIDGADIGKWQELADSLLASARDARAPGTHCAALDVAAHALVCSLVSSAVDLAPDRPRIEELLGALNSGHVASTPREMQDAVVVTEAHRLQSRRFGAVVVGGLSGTEFSPDRPDSVVRGIAERLGAPRAPDDHLAERLRFYSVVTRARQRVVLTHPSGGPGSDRERVSAFVEEVLDLYRSEEEREAGTGPSAGPVRHKHLHTGHGSAAEPSPSFKAALGRGAVARAEVATLAAARREYSISELETYIACPYRWFVQYVVHARSRAERLGRAQLGSLAHRALSEFYGAWRDETGRRRVMPGDEDSARSVLGRVWKGIGEAANPRTAEERHDVALVRRRVQALIEDDTTFLPSFEPCEHEFAFGTAAGREFPFAGVFIEGRIDRIDRGPGGLVVSDYKSASGITGHAKWADEGLLQLPVYAAVARHVFDETIAGTVYRSLATLRVRGAWIEDVTGLCSRGPATDATEANAIADAIADAEVRVREALEGMRAGRVPAAPARARGCTYCPIAPVCESAETTWKLS